MTVKKGGSPRLALLDHVPEMATVSDREGAIVYANPATELVSGYTPEEFVALDPFERMHAEDRPRCEEAFAELLRTPGLILELEHRVRHKDGTWRWVKGTFASLFDDPGVGGLLATVRDVTEAKEVEEALREGEDRQAFLLRLADALRPLADPVAVQAEAARVLGEHLGANRVLYAEVEPDEDHVVIHRDYTRGVPSSPGGYRLGDFGASAGRAYRQGRHLAIADAYADPSLDEVERAAYDAVHIRAHLSLPLVKGGRLVAVLSAQQAEPRVWSADEVQLIEEVAERTWAAVERARAEEALRESEARRHLALDAAEMGTFLWFPQEDRGEPDARMLELFGLEQGDALNLAEALGRMIHPDDREPYAAAVAKATDPNGGGRLDEEIRVVRPDGSLRWIAVTAQTVFEGKKSQATRVYGTAADVTERKRAEEERERLRALEASAHAEASERERISRELHDRVAHRMGVAHQSLELFAALRASAPERAEERLGLARESARLALDQTRAISAELKRLQDEELEDGPGAAFRALSGSSVPDGVRLEVSVSGEESKIPNAIAMQVYLAMREAIRNAVRHSGCSRIGVTLDVRDGEVVGSVEDDGEGFDPEAVGEATPSWGVGLRSMRERAEMLGGSFRIDSKPGAGATVEVRVPLDGRS